MKVLGPPAGRLAPALSVYSYATMMNRLGDQEDLRLRFDGLTKT
jgi:hypothetical protein